MYTCYILAILAISRTHTCRRTLYTHTYTHTYIHDTIYVCIHSRATDCIKQHNVYEAMMANMTTEATEASQSDTCFPSALSIRSLQFQVQGAPARNISRTNRVLTHHSSLHYADWDISIKYE